MTFREIFYCLDVLITQRTAAKDAAARTSAAPEVDDEFGREAERFVLDPMLSW